MKLWLRILISALVVILLGSLSGILGQASDRSWYQALNRPPGTPPGWVFGPVWTVLYALMGAAFALVWHQAAGTPHRAAAIRLFVIQMLLNLSWTPVFFGAQQILPALLIIISLWVLILLTIRRFLKVDATAAKLLIPYLIWVSYATYLNAGFLALN
ncbi:TspO/MBR family protein [Haloferula sp.]|uniref:TspO/MBR family protein n=1 Tax=Haloferula sp. TaxID=2497595 RepID=UPI003C72BC76